MLLHEIALLQPRIAPTPGCTGYWVKHATQMHTGYRGLHITLASAQMLGVYRRTLTCLAERGELTPRRARAAVPVIWHAAHALANTHLDEAAEALAWLRGLYPAFTPPVSAAARFCYRWLGYRNVHRLLRLRRRLLGRN